MKKSLTIFAVLLSFAFVTQAEARRPFGKKGMGMGPGMHHKMGGMGMKGHKGGCIFNKVLFMKHVLKLDDAQVEKLMKINLKYKIKRLNYKKVLAPLHIELKKQMIAENIDIPAIKKLLTRISSYQINKKLIKFEKAKEVM